MKTQMTSSPPRSRRSEAQPRWATRRRPERRTLGGHVAQIAELLGKPLMPWQRLVADVGLELDAAGLPAYREVWFSVMRQSGKTQLALPWEVHRCVSPVWDGPQRVVYTAQTGKDARKKLIDDQVPLLRASPLRKLITPAGGGRVRLAAGDVGVSFGTGGRIDLHGSTEASGHGSTIHLGVMDEAWKDVDDRREQALQPAMLTNPSAQILGYSTMGTDESIYLNRKVETGREATFEDRGTGIAYFEWSIPEHEDLDDPEVWWRYMPALGRTIRQEEVAHARQSMTDGDFRRALANQRTASAERTIPADVWDSVQDPYAEPSGELTWGVDVLRNIDGHDDAGAVAAYGAGKAAVVDWQPGTGWIVERVKGLYESRGGRAVIDGGGPAASIGDELEDAGVPVVRLKGGQVASACGRLYDDLSDGKVRIRPSKELDDAVIGLAKKPVGDRFVWSRTASPVDVTPLMAVTLARSGGLPEMQPEPFFLT